VNRPVPMSQPELVDLLKDILYRVQDGDSLEGSIEWALPDQGDPEDAYAMVRASYRVGNTAGQGGMRMVGVQADEPDSLAIVTAEMVGPTRELERFREEAAEDRWHRAVLRRHMAAHGLEDPTWAGLSEREKQVLRAADAEVLAASPRRLPTGMDAA
jgi:hypothetical protein